jgi:Uma2 family endonuclease
VSQSVRVPKLTIEEYLEFEERSSVRHEYIDGQIFAMSGATEAHNVICGNLYALVHAHVRGTGCRASINDMKVHVKIARSFYYPDIMVTCEPFEAKSVFKDSPVLIVEVLSPSTKQVDRREKLVAYRQLASLKEYVIVHQDRQRIEIYRKDSDDQWEISTLVGVDELQLKSLSKPVRIPVSAIYEDVVLTPFVEEPEEEYEPVLL